MPRGPRTDPPEPFAEFERDEGCDNTAPNDPSGTNPFAEACRFHGLVTIYQMQPHGEEEWECPRCGFIYILPCSCGTC